MTKIVDENGFWLIKDNPISKEGVFPYLGKTISPQLEPDKIYYVYRPAEELSSEETLESFNAVPLSDEHEMLGDGFTPYDKKPASGVLFNTHARDGEMYGDLKIFSETLKDEISNGKKELSLGYLCEYELKKGVWNGQPYDAVQKNLRGNHIALVERGRMGSDVRVYDKAITMDKLDIVIDNAIPSGDGSPKESGEAVSPTNIGDNQMVDKETMDADKREAIREIMAIAAKPNSDFTGGEEEKIETIAKLLEKSEYSKSEAGTANDEDLESKKDEKAEDKCGKDEDETKEEKKAEDESEEEKKDTEDEDEDKDSDKKAEDEEEKEDDKKSAEDSAKAVLKELDARASLKKELEPHIGAFACDGMTAKEIAAYGCKKLGLQATADEAQAVLRGFFAAHSKDNKVFGLDSAPVAKATGMDKSIQKYLND